MRIMQSYAEKHLNYKPLKSPEQRKEDKPEKKHKIPQSDLKIAKMQAIRKKEKLLKQLAELDEYIAGCDELIKRRANNE